MNAMGRQQAQRLKAWIEELRRHVSAPASELSFEGFTTFEQLTPEEAKKVPRRPFPPGTAWGACWEYGWFFCSIPHLNGYEGKRLVLSGGSGGEQLVYVNGRIAGSMDRKHDFVPLTACLGAEDCFEIMIESYAGHGARLENLGPCPPERAVLPRVEDAQCRTARGKVLVWNEDAYQLLLDVEILTGLLEVLPERSLRAMRVAEALEQFTHIADFEATEDARNASFREARKALAPALACRNGSTAPLLLLLGQSHIDLGWLWPVQETIRKSARTYGNQLALMEEYPEYRFLLCEPALLEMLKAYAPEVWERVLEAFRRGQIIPDGAFYVECDTNLPSGESLVRQLMWGRQWFRENFGVESHVAWQPDTFGFSGALPQLLRGFDIPYFATQKLLRADPEYPRFPYQNFIWEGIDGSEVQALSFFKNNATVDPASFHRRWESDRTQQEHIDTLLYPFGYGDGGGGATRDFVESARRMADLEGLPRSRYGTLEEYFRISEESAGFHRWVGELYLQWHRGTYSAQRRMKALMRRLQETLHDVELLLSMVDRETRDACAQTVRKAWEVLLFHQFHDIAAGVCIQRVHEEEKKALGEQLENMRSLRNELCMLAFHLKPEAGSWSMFNPLPWPVTRLISLPDGRQAVQLIPSGGAVNFRDTACTETVKAFHIPEGIVLENAALRAVVSKDGRIVSLVTHSDGREFAGEGGLNDWRLYRNVESVYDAWEMSADALDTPCTDVFETSVRLTMDTPLAAEVRVERVFSESRAVQTIRLEAGSRVLLFDNRISWHERHKLLKVHFHTTVRSRDALHEIQFGAIRRPAHRSGKEAEAFYEVCQQRYTSMFDEGCGLSLLNDGSYGISCDRCEMALTLLRAPLVPDPTCDLGDHELRYALLPYSGSFALSGTVQEAYALNQPPILLEGKCEERTGISGDGAVVETVKPAEDGRGSVIRLYEPYGRSGQVSLILPEHTVLTECGLSETEHGARYEGTCIALDMRPFQIRTFRTES